MSSSNQGLGTKKVNAITMNNMKRRELTRDEQLEAERLSAAWLSYKREHEGATQTWLGAESGIGTQGAVAQYLRGIIPLNIESLMAISRAIGVDPRMISPRLVAIVDGVLDAKTGSADSGMAGLLDMRAMTAAEQRLLTTYRLSGDGGKQAIDALVGSLIDRLPGHPKG